MLGIEAAVQATRAALREEDTGAVLLVDALNAFNPLTRQLALHNLSKICPTIATVLITHRALLWMKNAL